MKNKRMIIQLFLSYILLVIPILLVSSIFFNKMSKEMEKSMDYRIEKRCNDMIDEWENYLSEYQKKVVQILSMKEFSAEKMTAHKWSTQEGIQQLKNIVVMDSVLSDVILTYGENLYTSKGYCKADNFFKRALCCEEAYINFGKDLLKQDEIDVMYIPAEQYGYLFFHYPTKRQDLQIESINFYIRMDKIISQMEVFLEQVPTNIMITFQNPFQKEKIYLMGDIESGLKFSDEKNFHLVIDEQKLVVRSFHSEILDMEIQIFYDAKDVYSQAIYWRSLTEGSIVIFLFLAIILSYMLSSNYYQNILKLKQSIYTVMPKKQQFMDLKKENDFDIMHIMLDDLKEEMKHMEMETQNAHKLIQQQAVKLLLCSTMEQESIDKLLESYDMKIRGEFYSIVCVIQVEEKETLPLVMQNLLNENLGYISKVNGRHAIFILLEMPHEDILRNYRDEIGNKMMLAMKKTDNIKIVFSECFSNLQCASSAYLEVVAVCKKVLTVEGCDIGYIDLLDVSKEKYQNQIHEILEKKNEKIEKKIGFDEIMEYIEKNYYRCDLSLDDVADFAGFSKVYMSRFFKEKAGCRYIDYLTKCRMEHAKLLLEESDMSIKVIADMVGYNTVQGFRTKFKEYYGINASEYQKKIRENEQMKTDKEEKS